MKPLALLLIVPITSLSAEPVAGVPKRPLGVPADAKHFNGRWYKVVLEKKAWHAARDKCKDMGGRLVCVPDAVTWEFVKALTPAVVWLGATDEVTEGVWKWEDGGAMVWADWFANQPDNAGGTEHYLVTWRGKMADIQKSGKVGAQGVVGFICEWK